VKPVLLVVAGPNGAGKTTVTVRLREERWSEGVEAARWTEARREVLLASGAGIAFETVLSTASKLDFIARAKDREYVDLRVA
jgi:predicted ABC-type ATPase